MYANTGAGPDLTAISSNSPHGMPETLLARQLHKAASLKAGLLIVAAYASCLLQLAGLA